MERKFSVFSGIKLCTPVNGLVGNKTEVTRQRLMFNKSFMNIVRSKVVPVLN
jgi:hypothetical protein